MRLMLGTEGNPNLLVDADIQYGDYNDFDFFVVNGAWHGHFTNGHISINYDLAQNMWHERCGPSPWTSLDTMEILTDNQDRLRGEYQEVFNNFNNPDYVAPAYKYVPDDFDDDIPF